MVKPGAIGGSGPLQTLPWLKDLTMDHGDTFDDSDMKTAEHAEDDAASAINSRLNAREIARNKKRQREQDPRYQAMKAAAQKMRKEAYQKQKEKARLLRQEKKKAERESRLATRQQKDGELFQALRPGIALAEASPKADKPKLKLIVSPPE